MDIIRIISERITFVPYNYEYVLPVPQTDRVLVQDVLISIHGSVGTHHPGSSFGVSCNDIRLYANGVDLTAAYIESLKRLLSAKDQAVLKAEYAGALNNWLELEEKLGAAYGTPDLAREKEIARQFIETTPLSNNLNKLGDVKGGGWGGNLHMFNFLYRDITLPPVSLIDVVNRHNATPQTRVEPKEIQKLCFSSGPCRLFDASWDPANVPAGTLNCLLEIRLHNLLEDRVEKLEKDFQTMQEEITTAIQAIDEKLITEVNPRLREFKTVVDKASVNIAAAHNELKNHQTQLKALDDTTKEIKKAVETI